jgi:hypothetical protein
MTTSKVGISSSAEMKACTVPLLTPMGVYRKHVNDVSANLAPSAESAAAD